MRADAKENYAHLLNVAEQAVAGAGIGVSLREIARRAELGKATLLRHFPTREALLDALLQRRLEALTQKAEALGQSASAEDALIAWLQDAVAFVRVYSGVVSMMAAALADEESALHASCDNLRQAGARLLERGQADGKVRPDLTGEDLFALIGALGWIGDQPSFSRRSNHLFDVIASAILNAGPAIKDRADPPRRQSSTADLERRNL
jgi:AcrR family transcriptional regulator